MNAECSDSLCLVGAWKFNNITRAFHMAFHMKSWKTTQLAKLRERRVYQGLISFSLQKIVPVICVHCLSILRKGKYVVF